MRKQIYDLRTELRDKNHELEQIKRNTKVTKFQEIEVYKIIK